jgi:plasmid maintenance system killer protein
VNSRTRPSFWQAYAKLDAPSKQAARRAYALFAQNPGHPSLRFKKLGSYEQVWSVRINEQYRAIGERTGDTISWAWIGTHNEFDKLFG